jgi:hypothetical protein
MGRDVLETLFEEFLESTSVVEDVVTESRRIPS